MTYRGRPPKSERDRQQHSVGCRLTNAELVTLDARRGKTPRGAYIRSAALGNKPIVVPPINLDAWRALSRIASNLNQLAYHQNAGGKVEFSDVENILRDVRAGLLGLKKS